MTAPLTAEPPRPGVMRRFGFRFFAAYLLIYNASTIPLLVPYVGDYAYFIDRGWNQVVFWTERVVLGMKTLSSIKITGSGDTEFLWVQNGCVLAIALVASTAWTLFDRARRHDPMIRDFVRVCIRYILAMTLISWYGISKIVEPVQFPAPGGSRLVETVGAMSPMGLLWTLLGASAAYRAFSGVMEMLGGLLLLWRRTTPLGSIVSGGVLLNIVLMNFCFDVPVKLYSTNLLLMAGFLAWPDLKRIANVLVLNRPSEAQSIAPPWRSRGFRVFALVLKVIVIGSLFYSCYERVRKAGPEFKPVVASVEPLSGLWTVDTFSRDGTVLPPLLTDQERWRHVLIEDHSGGKRMSAFGVTGRWLGAWMLGPDSTYEKLVARPMGDPKTTVAFSLGHPAPDKLEMKGTVKDHVVVVTLVRADPRDTQLLTRGFRWISENPYNR